MVVSEKDIFKLIIEKKVSSLPQVIDLVKEEYFPRKKSDFDDREKQLIKNSFEKFNYHQGKFKKKKKSVDFDSILEKAFESPLFDCDSDGDADGPSGDVSRVRRKHWSELGRRQKIEVSKSLETKIKKMISDFAEEEEISPIVYVEFLLTRFKSNEVFIESYSLCTNFLFKILNQ